LGGITAVDVDAGEGVNVVQYVRGVTVGMIVVVTLYSRYLIRGFLIVFYCVNKKRSLPPLLFVAFVVRHGC
jgi:hypothetical protein